MDSVGRGNLVKGESSLTKLLGFFEALFEQLSRTAVASLTVLETCCHTALLTASAICMEFAGSPSDCRFLLGVQVSCHILQMWVASLIGCYKLPLL